MHLDSRLILFAGCLLGASLSPQASAAALDIDWASTFSNVVTNGGPFDPSLVLGAPDGLATGVHEGGSVNDGLEETATFSGFGGGATTGSDSASLASFLGVAEATVAIADFLVFEFQGIGPFPFEPSRWLFSDGTNSFFVNHLGSFATTTGVLKVGNVSSASYISFFGPLTNTNIGVQPAYLLFDVDGNSAVDMASAGFSARITAGLGPQESPDPDAMGRIAPAAVVPAPAPGPLLAGGIGLRILLGWRARRGAGA